MKYHINEKTGYLHITCTPEEQREWIPQVRKELHSSGTVSAECEVMERLLADSCLEWIPDGSTGDLTSAPMLGILGEEDDDKVEHFGSVLSGHWGMSDHHRPIIARWAYMEYALRSFLDDLAEKGECVWEGGYAPGNPQQFDHDPRFDEGGEYYAEANPPANLQRPWSNSEILREAQTALGRVSEMLCGDGFDKNEVMIEVSAAYGLIEVVVDALDAPLLREDGAGGVFPEKQGQDSGEGSK